ncbi:hypothetical protein [Hoyosella altamirensis]|uniref:hypothetical protein n=1 Tax=Hoyosella altamirensis TaxID=616997 RepID=UPI0007DAEE96|nr:hypothetical protein [Hoyosella altamirensis]
MTTIDVERQKLSQVLAKASFLDKHFSTPDPNIVKAWAEATLTFQLELQDMMNAVTAHYQDQNQNRSLRVADLIKRARAIRNDRIQRARAANHHALDAAERRMTRDDPRLIGDVLPRKGILARVRREIDECPEGCAPAGLVMNDHNILGRCLHDGRVDVSDPRALPVGYMNPDAENYIPPGNRHPNWKDPLA